jgi:hypothetical protein
MSASDPKRTLQSMKIPYSACVVMTCLCVTGCRAPDQGKLDALAAAATSTGGRLDDVMGRLSREGFECDPKSTALRVHCSRRSGSPIHACVENVTFVVDPARNKVTDATAGKVACAGF